MNPRNQTISAVLLFLIVSCTKTETFREFGDNERSEILSRFQSIEIGMTEEQAASILGEPLIELNQNEDGKAVLYWETQERALEPSESPFMRSGVELMIREGLVTRKTFNHQWVNRNQLELFMERTKKGERY